MPIGIQPLISYDVFNKDTDADRDVESNWQVGFNWHINKLLRTQVAYTRKTFVHSAKDGTDLLEAQLLLSF